MMMPKVDGLNPIVVVDDCEHNLLIAKRCIARSFLSNEAVMLQSGLELLCHMEHVALGDVVMPSLVLLDIDMPGGMSGLDTLRRVRSHKDFAMHPRIIMLTSSSDPRHYQQACLWGANAFKARPNCGKEYLDFLNSLVGGDSHF